MTAKHLFIGIGFAVCTIGVAAIAQPTQPALRMPGDARHLSLPKRERLMWMSDDELYQLYLKSYPDPRDDPNARVSRTRVATNDLDRELDVRASNRWGKLESLELGKAIASLKAASDFQILLWMRGAPRDSGEQRLDLSKREWGDPNAPANWKTLRAAVFDEAIRRGGRLFGVAARSTTFSDLHKLSDDQIRQSLVATEGQEGYWGAGNYEPILNEIIRRGGSQWEALLTDATICPRRFLGQVGEEPQDRNAPRNIEALIALRRLQHKPEPIAIVVDRAGIVLAGPNLPRLNAAIVNVDAEHLPVLLDRGGDHDKSGRSLRWRFEVRDVSGKLMPAREGLVGSAGGPSSEGPLEYGQRWRCELEMGEFVPALPPGEYTARILFHNEAWLAALHNIDGLIYSQSAPIKLSIRPPK